MGIAIALAIGLVAGFSGGMLGVGGGFIMIPGMVLLLGLEQHTAQGTALVVVIGTAIVGVITHYRQGTISVRTVAWVAPVAMVFSLVAAWLVGFIPEEWLRRIFGLLLLLTGAGMLWGKRG